VLVAVLGVGELLVGDGDLCGVAVGVEVDGDEGVGRGAALPAPGVDEFAGRLDEAVGAEDGVDVAAFVSDGDSALEQFEFATGGYCLWLCRMVIAIGWFSIAARNLRSWTIACLGWKTRVST